MIFSGRKIVAAIAWGLAFGSTAEMVSAGIYGGCYGRWAGGQMKKGRSVEEIMDEITASSPDIWTKWRAKWKIVTPVAGVIGLLLGLKGLLPGTENSSGT